MTLTRIGHGAHGFVYTHECSEDVTVAVKAVRARDEGGTISTTTARELMALKRVKGHANVLTLLSIIPSPRWMYIVTDYIPTCLRSVMKVNTGYPLSEPMVKHYMGDLLCGMAHCHSHNIIHRDLKPENLLISLDGVLKIADFGLSRPVMLGDRPLTPQMVTLWYRSIEVLTENMYSFDVDVWSAGCIFYEMLTGNVLFCADGEIDMIFEIESKLDRSAAHVRFKIPTPSCHLTRFFDAPSCRITMAEAYKASL